MRSSFAPLDSGFFKDALNAASWWLDLRVYIRVHVYSRRWGVVIGARCVYIYIIPLCDYYAAIYVGGSGNNNKLCLALFICVYSRAFSCYSIIASVELSRRVCRFSKTGTQGESRRPCIYCTDALESPLHHPVGPAIRLKRERERLALTPLAQLIPRRETSHGVT